MSSSTLKKEEMDPEFGDEYSLEDEPTDLTESLSWQDDDDAEIENVLSFQDEELFEDELSTIEEKEDDTTSVLDVDEEMQSDDDFSLTSENEAEELAAGHSVENEDDTRYEVAPEQMADNHSNSMPHLPDLPDSTFIQKLFNKEASETSFISSDANENSTPSITAPHHEKQNFDKHDYNSLVAELHLALSSLKNLDHIESLNSKIDALYDLNRILQLHEEVLEPLQNLQKLSNLRFLDKLDGLKELVSIQELKKLDNLSKLSHIERISELSQLDKLTELQALSGLTQLQSLHKLDSLQKLDNLDKLDNLENLHLLDKLDETGLVEKVERLERINILNKKMHVLFLSQVLGVFLELLKFACAAGLVLYLISTQVGQKFTTSALTATGFGSSAQTNLGLILLQGEVAEPQFSEIIENVRKKIKADYHRALSLESRLSLGERVNIISEVLDYNYDYKGTSIQEETRQAVTQQVLYAKNLVVSKIEFDIAIASNQDRPEDVKKLKELKVFFLNGNYTKIIEEYKNHLEKSESIKMATIIATMEMYLKDPQTLQQMIIL